VRAAPKPSSLWKSSTAWIKHGIKAASDALIAE